MFEERVRLLAGAKAARTIASGMAAVSAAIVSYVKSGDHIVAARALFGSCRYVIDDICPHFVVDATLVHGPDIEQWRDAIRSNTKIIFLASPSNPMLVLVDIQAVSRLAPSVGAIVIVDNVFATPMVQRPLASGADVVVYSATKHIDGQGRCLGGVILVSNQYVKDHRHPFLRHTGPSLSPFNAGTLLKGLETLPIRVERQVQSASRIADVITGNPAASRVFYCSHDHYPQADFGRRQMSGGGKCFL